MTLVEEIVDRVIKDNPELYKKAKFDSAYVGALRNECAKYNRTISTTFFSGAIFRRIEADLEQEEKLQNNQE